MKKTRYRGNHIFCFIFIIIFLACFIPLESTPSFLEGAAGDGVFESDKFNENITIALETIQTIDFNLQEGEEFEIIFSLQVKNNLPVDVWFVTEDHYLLLASGSQFLYFIDGSEQDVTYTKNIVTLTEHDSYKLAVVNKNNQTVEVNIEYEIRTYYTDSSETSSEDLPIFSYILLLTIIILTALVIALIFKIRRLAKAKPKVTNNTSTKKGEKIKLKKAKSSVTEKGTEKKIKTRKAKHVEPKTNAEETLEKAKIDISEQEKLKVLKKVSPSFCGQCGKAVTTPFCIHCGHHVNII